MRVDNFKTDKTPVKTSKKGKQTIHILHILDSSGSMGHGEGSKWKAAVQGVQTEIAELKKDKTVNYIFSLVVFGTTSKRIIWQQPIAEAEYSPDWRSTNDTSLYQTTGETLETYPQDNPVLVKIFTDSMSNYDRGRYNRPEAVKKLIDELSDKNFTITFVGTKADVEQIHRRMGISLGNTLVHDNTGEGVEKSFRKSLGATMNYAQSVSRGEFTKTLNFYES